MNKRTRDFVLFGSLAALLLVAAPSATAEGTSLIPNLSPAKGPNDVGIVFSASDLFFDLQDYQGGIGVKVGWGKFSLRGLVDFNASYASRAMGAGLGVTAEYHFLSGPISPYVGGLVGASYLSQSDVTSVVNFSFGGVAGVEVFIADFLSIFAEYALTALVSNTYDVASSQNTFDTVVNTAMGNNAKLGVVIYFMRSEAKNK